MRSLLFLSALAAAGCNQSSPQQSSQKPAEAEHPGTIGAAAATGSGAEAYKLDIENLCEAMERSGAAKESPDSHQFVIANWLAANLTTEDSRKFLVKIQPLVGEDKAKALDEEAKRVGLASCSLSAEWRKPPAQ